MFCYASSWNYTGYHTSCPCINWGRGCCCCSCKGWKSHRFTWWSTFFTHNWEPQIKLSVSFLSGSFLQWTLGNNECQRPWTPHVQVSSVQIKFILSCSIGSQHLDRLSLSRLENPCNPSIESPREGSRHPSVGKGKRLEGGMLITRTKKTSTRLRNTLHKFYTAKRHEILELNT